MKSTSKLSMIAAKLNSLPEELTAHGTGIKQVFIRNSDVDTNLTQFAFGTFEAGEICAEHTHPTMDECFFFIEGYGEYQVGENLVSLEPNTFLRIPAGTKHELKANKGTKLRFVYFGIATEK